MIIEDDVREFVRRMPDLSKEGEPPSTHLLMLIVRSRYSKEFYGVKLKDIVVERKIIRPTQSYRNEWRENYIQKLHNLSLLQEHGKYLVKDVLVDKKCLGVLATLSPRRVVRASSQLIKYVADRFDDNNLHNLNRLDLEFFSRLHANKNREPFLVTIDVDNAELFNDVRDDLTPYNKWMITKTARGYHIILDLDTEQSRVDFYHKGGGDWDKMTKKYGDEVERSRESQEPIPGTFYYSPLKENNYVEIVE